MELKEQLRDWLLLVVLLLVSAATMLTQNQPLVRALRAQSLEVTAQVESSLAWMGRYVQVLQENAELRRENIELSSTVARTREARMRNRELQRMLNLRDTSRASLQAARIVTKDIFRQKNFLTLNVGRADSIRPGMPVLHESGIVGTVVLVSEDFSRVMPFLNTDFRVPGVLLPLRAEGIVQWNGERLDQLLMEHVVKTEPVEPGQVVVTSGHSDVFPPGRRIGTVDSVATQPGRSELRVYLTPAVSLNKISHVFVLQRTAPPQQQRLEAQPVE